MGKYQQQYETGIELVSLRRRQAGRQTTHIGVNKPSDHFQALADTLYVTKKCRKNFLSGRVDN